MFRKRKPYSRKTPRVIIYTRRDNRLNELMETVELLKTVEDIEFAWLPYWQYEVLTEINPYLARFCDPSTICNELGVMLKLKTEDPEEG